MGGAEWDRLNRGGSSDLSSPSHTEMPVERSRGSQPAAFKTKTKPFWVPLLVSMGVGGRLVYLRVIVLTPSIIHSGVQEAIRKSCAATENRVVSLVSRASAPLSSLLSVRRTSDP